AAYCEALVGTRAGFHYPEGNRSRRERSPAGPPGSHQPRVPCRRLAGLCLPEGRPMRLNRTLLWRLLCGAAWLIPSAAAAAEQSSPAGPQWIWLNRQAGEREVVRSEE